MQKLPTRKEKSEKTMTFGSLFLQFSPIHDSICLSRRFVNSFCSDCLRAVYLVCFTDPISWVTTHRLSCLFCKRFYFVQQKYIYPSQKQTAFRWARCFRQHALFLFRQSRFTVSCQRCQFAAYTAVHWGFLTECAFLVFVFILQWLSQFKDQAKRTETMRK